MLLSTHIYFIRELQPELFTFNLHPVVKAVVRLFLQLQLSPGSLLLSRGNVGDIYLTIVTDSRPLFISV